MSGYTGLPVFRDADVDPQLDLGTRIVGQERRVFMAVIAVDDIVAADLARPVVDTPAALDFAWAATLDVARVAVVDVIADNGTRGCAHHDGGFPAIAFAHLVAEDAADQTAEVGWRLHPGG